MANDVKMTLTGDPADLERAFDRAQRAMQALAVKAESTSGEVVASYKDQAAAAQRMADDLKAAGKEADDAFDKAAEGADSAETRFQGARDGVTGLQDSMASLSSFAKGDFQSGLLLAGSGAADLASSVGNALVPALKAANTWWGNLNKTMKGSIIGIAAAVAAAAAAWIIFRKNTDDAGQSVEDLNDDLKVFAQTGVVTGALRRLYQDTGTLAENFDILSRKTNDYTDKVGYLDSLLGKSSLDYWAEDQQKAAENIDKVDKALANAIKEGADYYQILDVMGITQRDVNEYLDDFKNAAGDAVERNKALAKTTQVVADAYRDASDNLQEYTNLIRAQTDPLFAYRQAQIGIRDAQRDLAEAQENLKEKQKELTEAVKEHGAKSEEAIVLQREVAAAHDGVLRAQDAVVQSQLNLVDSTSKLSEVNQTELITTLQQLQADGYLTQDAFNLLTDAINASKDAVDRLDGSRADIALYYKVYGQGSTEEAQLQYEKALMSSLPPRAAGGPVDYGMAYLVGEHGPEVFVPGSNGNIIPNSGVGASMGGNTINITLNMDDLKQLQDLYDFLDLLRNNSRRGLVTA